MSFFPGSGFVHGAMFQGCTRYAVKLDFIAGLLAKALRCTGGDEARSNQVLLGEVIAWRHLFWSLSNAMANNPQPVERRRRVAGTATPRTPIACSGRTPGRASRTSCRRP